MNQSLLFTPSAKSATQAYGCMERLNIPKNYRMQNTP